MKKFKVGDRIILPAKGCGYSESISNPYWGGSYGKVVGTVEGLNDGLIQVTWDNRQHNTYTTKYLQHYLGAPKAMLNTAKNLANTFHTTIKPYEKYIGLVALAVVIDHFFLDSKFSSRFKKLAEALVDKITGGLDSLVNKLTDNVIEEAEKEVK